MNTEQLRQALSISPDNVPLLILYAQACLEAWNFEEARKAFDRVLALQPANADAAIGVAEILFRMGNTSESLVRLEVLSGKNALTPRGRLVYARALLAAGNAGQARSQYEAALAADTSLKDAELERQIETAVSSQQETAKKVAVPSGAAPDNDIDALLNSIATKDGPGSRITFADVGGMTEVKEQIKMKIIYPLQNKGLFSAYGKKAGGGVLLYGPPGCGKTLISRSIAGEINATFLTVGIHQILDMYLGNSEKNLHEIFELARTRAPAILFIDEVDALASDRTYLRQSAGRTLINQFLAEMDGIDAQNDNVLIMAATNAPWHLDPAFKRPGRFDRILFVPPPDAEARQAILAILVKGKPVDNIDLGKVAEKSEGFSGADLQSVIEVASETVLAKAMKAGRVVPLTTGDLLAAAKKVKPSTRAWFESAKNYALFANQAGFYDDVLPYVGLQK